MKTKQKTVEIAKSRKENSLNAGKEIGRKLSKIDTKTVFLFFSVKYKPDELIKGILSEIDAEICGCSGAGVICNDEIIEKGAVAIGFNKEGLSFGLGVGTNINKNPFQAGIMAINSALDSLKKKNLKKIFAKFYAASINDPTQIIQKTPSCAVMTFIDGLCGREEEVLKGITSRFAFPMPLAGGSAGDDLILKETIQICNNKAYKNSVVTALLVTNSKLCFAIDHGWIPRKETVLVTKAKGRRVYELNGKPAIEAYAKLLGVKKDKLIKEKQIAFKTGLRHPLAIVSVANEYFLRHPKEILEDGSITFFSEVSEGVALVATDASRESLINAGLNAAKKITRTLNKEIEALFIFNCVARKVFLGKKAEEEIKRIFEITNAPTIGFYTYGEQAFSQATPISHRNQTINMMGIGK